MPSARAAGIRGAECVGVTQGGRFLLSPERFGGQGGQKGALGRSARNFSGAIVPTNHKAPYFMCLKQRSVGRSVIVGAAGAFQYTDRQMPQHTLFAVDFGGPGAERAAPACGQEYRRRTCGREFQRIDEQERTAITEKLIAPAESLLPRRAGV